MFTYVHVSLPFFLYYSFSDKYVSFWLYLPSGTVIFPSIERRGLRYLYFPLKKLMGQTQTTKESLLVIING